MKRTANEEDVAGMKRNAEENDDSKKANVEEDEKLSRHCWFCTLYAAVPAMIVFGFNGVTEAQSATMLPQLKKQGSPIHITTDEETWIASLGVVLCPISAILIGSAIDAFGRKKGLQFYYLCMGLGFGVIACAKETYHIYVGRCICSFAVGLEVVPVVYLAEISTSRQRSCFFSLMLVVYSGGVALTYGIGILPWQVGSTIYAIGCFLTFILQCLTPESPAWLYKTNQIDASTKSLRHLGRSTSGILKELELLKLNSITNKETVQWREFLLPTVWKPFVIMVIFQFIQHGSGVFDILYYTVDFIDALGTSYDPLNVSILLALARLVTNATFGIYFTAHLPKKITTTFSALGMTIGFAGMGTYEYLYKDVPVKPFEWVPITLLFFSKMTCLLAMSSLPWVMGGNKLVVSCFRCKFGE